MDKSEITLMCNRERLFCQTTWGRWTYQKVDIFPPKIVNYIKMTEKALKTKKYMTDSCFAQPDFYRTLYNCPEYMTVLEALM